MKIQISIEVVGDRVVANCSPLNLSVNGDHLKCVMDQLNESIHRQIYLEVQSGEHKASDPSIVRLIGGDDGDSGVEFEFDQIAHDIYMERIESLMAKHYPSMLDEVMWHMLVPRHRAEGCLDMLNKEQLQLFVEADARERLAYDDLEINGPAGIKWQTFLAEYMADPDQGNKKFLVKHGLVEAQNV